MLVFPHIPKTGGTTLFSHFRAEKGKEAVLSVGPTARVSRFVAGLPQIEDMQPSQVQQLFCLQGHGVCEDTLLHARAEDLRLLVVLRDPLGHSLSRFNHKRSAMARKSGRLLSPEQFMARFFRDDYQCHYLVTKFPSFVDPGIAGIFAQARSVLRKFDYVLSTEALDAQFAQIAPTFGVTPAMTRKRVAQGKLGLGVATAKLMSRLRGDHALVRAVTQHDDPQVPRYFNPFGFDGPGRARALAQLARQHPAPSRVEGYHELASGLCMTMRAEQAFLLLAQPDADRRVADPELLTELLRRRWAHVSQTLTAVEQARSDRILARTRKRLKRAARLAGAVHQGVA
nr:hypothetical protein [uncultured Celeribacter sp.]